MKNADELVAIYEMGIRHFIDKALRETTPETLYADSTGVAVARGILWFGCPIDKCSKTRELRVTQLNPQKN